MKNVKKGLSWNVKEKEIQEQQINPDSISSQQTDARENKHKDKEKVKLYWK